MLTDVVGAVFGVTFSRFALAISSYWQTTNPDRVWLVQLARLATCIPLCIVEQLMAQTLFPGNAGSSLFHAFLLANMLIMTGSVRAPCFVVIVLLCVCDSRLQSRLCLVRPQATFGYDVWRRICCGLDAFLGVSGTSAGILGLL